LSENKSEIGKTSVDISFINTLSAEEKHYIKDRTNALMEMLRQWARQHHLIRAIRIPAAALVAATALPRIPLADSLLVAQMMLWIFAVDDIADEHIVTLADMRRKTEQWCLIAYHGVDNQDDDLTTILLEMRKKLSKSHLFEPLREYWASRLRLLGETMIQEYQDGLQYDATYGMNSLPSLDKYLHNGIHSIGLPFWKSTVLILLQDNSVIQQFEPINQAIEYAGAAVRLYNDVRSLDKEIHEGNINSIIIKYHMILERIPSVSREEALAEARQHILQLADSYAQRCYGQVRQIETSSGQFEEATNRIVAFHAYFYGRSEYDYHTTSQAAAYEILGGKPEKVLPKTLANDVFIPTA
jgi:hypothetical protein